MRIVLPALLLVGALVAPVRAAPIRAEDILDEASRRLRETPAAASYVISLSSRYGEEEVYSQQGSLIAWFRYPRVRLEATGLEDIFFPVEIVDSEAKVVYVYSPDRGWGKTVFARSWLALWSYRGDPLLRRLAFGPVEEGTLGGKDVWILRGEAPPDPLGIMPVLRATFWIERDSFLELREEEYFELYYPGLDFATANRSTFELTGYRKLEDIPAERFAVPPDAPEIPDLSGRVFPYPAPDLRGTTTAGEEVALADFAGKVLVLYFWNMGLSAEDLGIGLSLMDGLWARGRDQGVAVLGVTDMDAEMAASFMEGFGSELPTVAGASPWADALGIEPAETPCVIIDREGNVYARTDPFSALALVLELVLED